ncbi:MAG: hypothetical protein JXX14_21950 [Deltaproteobacteria bacterium]|nr:hypothetical protein [Deltaproteobacteria bacterium]
MTFSCPNHEAAEQKCTLLNTLCVPGRPGCVLEGKATFAEDIDTRIRQAEEIASTGRRRQPRPKR